jgi:threonylcarbamoyladenosine tRNA methylthiotransferase MtaB
MAKKRIAFHTFGCKLNFAETSGIARSFPKEDYEVVDFKDEADYYVINTCTVTGNAEKKCKSAVGQALKRNPKAEVTMMGCFSQNKSDIVSKFKGVKLVLGNEEKFDLYTYIENPNSERAVEVYNADINKSKVFNITYSSDDRTRTFLKVQDGCDYFCTYCAIPKARGRSRSETIANTIKVAEKIGRSEVKEIILTGVNIGDFGRQTGEKFIDFLKALEQIEGIERIRISSIEPELLTHEIIDLVAKSDKFLPHFHIPLQSGSNKVLKEMKRKYTREVYTDRVEYIKSLMPDACIACDLIVGFPTETEEDFQDTYDYLKDLDISYMHIFTYSHREDTYALKLKEVLNPKQRRARAQQMHELSHWKKRNFYKENTDTIRSVLFEAANNNGWMSGWTENYIKVIAPFNENLINKVVELPLSEVNEDGNFVYNG